MGRTLTRGAGRTRAFRTASPPGPTVRRVSGNPVVSLFAGDPQPVEIHHRGIWFSGELLGWTTQEGRVLARVRCVVDGLRHSTWKDLAELRLPDPARPPRREPFPSTAAARQLGLGRDAVDDEDDATRPHVLLAGAGARTRPQKPEHARTPPAVHRRAEPVVRPAPIGRSGPVANPNRRRRSDELTPV